MVSANCLAELDSQLRSRMSAARATNAGANGEERPFGGLNTLFCGDFYQLEPPSGAAINALPTSYLKNARRYAPGATEDRGQRIFWGVGGEGAGRGMAELTECKRVEEQDEWFLGVQDEFRRGQLTERARISLYGKPTDVPGRGRTAQRNAETRAVERTQRRLPKITR